jgi:hypothetical protein
MTIARNVLDRITDAVTDAVVRSGAVWNAAVATRMIEEWMADFTTSPDYGEWRDGLGVWYEESDIVTHLADNVVFNLRLGDPSLADEPAIRHIKSAIGQ